MATLRAIVTASVLVVLYFRLPFEYALLTCQRSRGWRLDSSSFSL